MDRQKPARLDARLFKNAFISSRNQIETTQSSLLTDSLRSTPAFTQVVTTAGKAEQTGGGKKQGVTASSTSIEANSSSSKRLKLKDYIHLNGIEKRSRSKNNSSCLSRRVKTVESSTVKEQNDLKNTKNNFIEVPPSGESSQRTAEENSSMMIKQEIKGKIREEQKKLADLQAYLEGDFVCKPDAKETFVFLFDIYNKMIEVRKINEEVGTRIIEYGKAEQKAPLVQQPSFKTPKIEKQMSYHWEEDRRQLDSPAKIMNNALKMTFDLTKLFNIV